METSIIKFTQNEQAIIQLEKQLIEAVYNNQPEILKQLTLPSTIFVSGKHGYVTIDRLMAGLAHHPKILQWELNNLNFIDFTEHSLILTYQSTQILFDHTHLSQYSTSIWAKKNNQWKLAYHQKSNSSN